MQASSQVETLNVSPEAPTVALLASERLRHAPKLVHNVEVMRDALR